MSASRDAGNNLSSTLESGLNHNPGTTSAEGNVQVSSIPQPEEEEEASRASLLGNPSSDEDHHIPASAASAHDRDLHSGAEKLRPADPQAGRSCTWFRRDGWAPEILAAICSIGCLVAIVAVLEAFDGQRSPSLSYGITLNAIISILSTTAKSSLMYGIASAIGQCKWDWFNDEGRYHALRDLEHIDEASRGPLGAFRMFFTPTRWSIASMGAIVTLLMLAVDPFIQQILRYQQEPNAVASETAWTEQVLAPTIFSNNSDPAYFGAINSGLWNDYLSYERQAHCPTGNCTYPSFQSLGLCMSTREVPLDQVSFGGTACNTTYTDSAAGQVVIGNLTDALVTVLNDPRESEACRAFFWGDNTTSLPWGPRWRQFPGAGWGIPLESTGPTHSGWVIPLDLTGSMESQLGGEQLILGIRSPLLTLGRIRLSSPSLISNTSMSFEFEKAEQVVITFCANDYEVKVSEGITSISGANVSTPSGFSYSDSTTILDSNATCWTSGSEQSTFAGAEIKQADHGRYIASTSPLAFCTDNWGWGTDIASRLTSSSYFGMDYRNTWYMTGDSGVNNKDVHQQIQSRSLPDISWSITASLNALFRKYSSDRVTGSYIEYQTVVRVQWPWLALPVAVEILGFVFLLLIAFRHQRSENPWKGSILAALFHGLRSSDHGNDSLDTITSMEREATKTVVKLDTSDDGKKFLHKRSE